MNLNKKITKFKGDGIPAYNDKINELIDATNWLAGFRTINGKPIAESDQGPIIDLSSVNSTQTGGDPTATDPDGNQAGWRKVTLIDWIRWQFFDVWAWTGSAVSNIQTVPWMFDLSGIKASWLSGGQGEVWGTGSYPAGATANYRQAKFTSNVGSNNKYISPVIWTGYALNPPITPPTSAPALYLMSSTAYSGIDSPYFRVTVDTSDIPQTIINDINIPVNFTWVITYDGATVFSYSGSHTFNNIVGFATEIPLDKTGWVFDPQGLPGYTYGNQRWIYKYMGPISANPNPPIIETLTWNMPSFSFYVGVSAYIFGAILLTG